MSDADDRRRRLQVIKLAGLVRDRGAQGGEPSDLGGGVATATADTAMVLLERGSPGELAGSVLWARRRGLRRLEVFCDHGAGLLARLAGHVDPAQLVVDVRAVTGSTSAPAVPEPPPGPDLVPVVPVELTDLLESRGLDVVHEHGEVLAEELGLEVARLVRWPSEHGGDDELHLEAGVGRFDRDAVAAVHADDSPERSLDRALDLVRAHRYRGAPPHPVQLLVRERWLRHLLVEQPGLVGASSLAPVSTSIPRAGLKDAHPAAAIGTCEDGRSVVAVCSVGVDLAAPLIGADTRAMHDPDALLVLVVHHGDRHRAIEEVADVLSPPTRLVGVDAPWE